MTTWKQRIAAAKKRGRFTIEDEHDSIYWDRCAVSEIRTDIGKWTTSADLPRKLYYLGHKFHAAVMSDGLNEAEKLYKEIQKFK